MLPGFSRLDLLNLITLTLVLGGPVSQKQQEESSLRIVSEAENADLINRLISSAWI
jgi:hypothetical protein